MRESLLLMNNERGSYLPFVLIISIIIFSTITTMITVYKNEKIISTQLWELMKTETIVAMTKQKFIDEDMFELGEDGYITYSFPSGDVYVNYNKIEENIYSLFLQIKTDYGESIFIETFATMYKL